MSSVPCPSCGRETPGFNPRCVACGTPLPEVSAAVTTVEAYGGPRPGEQISHFRLLSVLGRGGMGVVYRALDLELEREVAVKLLSPSGSGGPEAQARFRREARAAAALDHPNIGTVHEIGEHQGRLFLVMALYEGETLEGRMAREPRPVPLREAAGIAAALAAALAAAHAAGVVHRDVKPSNVLLTRDGRVKLVDFGLARREGGPALTEAGLAVGTLDFMAPEQLRGEESDARTDLWALGVVLYEMLAGRRPFGGDWEARQGRMLAILHEAPAPLAPLRPDVPAALAAIVARCLEKEPERRWPSAAAVCQELVATGLVPEPSSTAGLAVLPGRPPLSRRRRLAGWAAAAVLLTMALVYTVRLLAPPPPRVHVAVLRPEVTGTASAAERSRVAHNLQVAAMRGLTALDRVTVLDPTALRAVPGTPRQSARAAAADELITTESDCTADLCAVTLRRIAGDDGRVLWTEALRLPPGRYRLFAEAVSSAVRRAYGERAARQAGLELAIGEAEYRRFLEISRGFDELAETPERTLASLAELRRQAPAFLDVYTVESSLAALLFSQSGDPVYLERGLEVAGRARELAPEDPRPVSSLFDLTLAAGRLGEAESLLVRLEALEPDSAGLLVRRARLAEHQGDGAKAVTLFTIAVERQPAWQHLLALANLEYRLGRLADARRHLEELLARSPGNVRGLQALAQIELLDGDASRAAALYADLARRTGAASDLSNAGTALLLLRRPGEALAVFRRGLAREPANPLIELNLADSLWLLGRRQEALDTYRRMAGRVGGGEVTLSTWPLHTARAQALAHLGDHRSAVETVQRVLRLVPANPQAAYEAALVYTLVGDRTSALLLAEKAVRGGVTLRWFEFPWFDPLRREPAFAALSVRSPAAPEAPGRRR